MARKRATKATAGKSCDEVTRAELAEVTQPETTTQTEEPDTHNKNQEKDTQKVKGKVNSASKEREEKEEKEVNEEVGEVEEKVREDENESEVEANNNKANEESEVETGTNTTSTPSTTNLRSGKEPEPKAEIVRIFHQQEWARQVQACNIAWQAIKEGSCHLLKLTSHKVILTYLLAMLGLREARIIYGITNLTNNPNFVRVIYGELSVHQQLNPLVLPISALELKATKVPSDQAYLRDKEEVVIQHLRVTTHWQGAAVLPLQTIVNMIVKMKFIGDLSMSLLKLATRGLTPFATPNMQWREVDKFNKWTKALDSATSTSMNNHLATKLKARIMSTFDLMVQLLKQYGNLLFAMFGEEAPLYTHLKDVVGNLEDYTDFRKSAMSLETITSIMWITHLQSQHMATGDDKFGPGKPLLEFEMMKTCILTSQPINHGKIPTALRPKTPTNIKSTKRKSKYQ